MDSLAPTCNLQLTIRKYCQNSVIGLIEADIRCSYIKRNFQKCFVSILLNSRSKFLAFCWFQHLVWYCKVLLWHLSHQIPLLNVAFYTRFLLFTIHIWWYPHYKQNSSAADDIFVFRVISGCVCCSHPMPTRAASKCLKSSCFHSPPSPQM